MTSKDQNVGQRKEFNEKKKKKKKEKKRERTLIAQGLRLSMMERVESCTGLSYGSDELNGYV